MTYFVLNLALHPVPTPLLTPYPYPRKGGDGAEGG